MSDNLGEETVPPALSGPDAPRFTPVAPGVVVDLALLESLNLSNAEERAAASAQAAEVISDAEARAAKLIAAAVADAEDQVADIRPLAEAEAEKIVQEARDEASSIESKADETAEQTIASANETLEQAGARAQEIVTDAEARAEAIITEAETSAADLNRTLEIDRELVKERLTSLEEREAETTAKLAEAERTLEHARAEAQRMTTEAGEAVDRMMRSGQMVAESQRQEYHSEQEAIQALHSQHATDLRELTDRYETKVSNQNIENLELRQEIEALREALDSLEAAPPRPERVPDEPAPVDEEPDSDLAAEFDGSDNGSLTGLDTDDDSFVSQWMVPDVEEEISDEVVDFDESSEAEQDTPETDQQEAEPVRSLLGPSTGLAPNARLVEGLQASVFRPAEDPKKRRRRKR